MCASNLVCIFRYVLALTITTPRADSECQDDLYLCACFDAGDMYESNRWSEEEEIFYCTSLNYGRLRGNRFEFRVK